MNGSSFSVAADGVLAEPIYLWRQDDGGAHKGAPVLEEAWSRC